MVDGEFVAGLDVIWVWKWVYFFVVKWGFAEGFVRWFFRMSEVEWLYDFIPASVRFLVKNNPLAVKYNSMSKRLHFLKRYKINILSVKYFSLHLSVKLYYCTNTVIQLYILYPSILIYLIYIITSHKNTLKDFFKKRRK